MELAEVKMVVEDLRGRLEAPFSPADKEIIEKLYYEVLAKSFVHTSCQQCYHDGLIEIYIYLKKYGKMANKPNYRLRAGAIINCTSFMGGKVFSNDNLTDDVARKYIEQFPEGLDLFQKIPNEKKGEKKEKKEPIEKKVSENK